MDSFPSGYKYPVPEEGQHSICSSLPRLEYTAHTGSPYNLGHCMKDKEFVLCFMVYSSLFTKQGNSRPV